MVGQHGRKRQVVNRTRTGRLRPALTAIESTRKDWGTTEKRWTDATGKHKGNRLAFSWLGQEEVQKYAWRCASPYHTYDTDTCCSRTYIPEKSRSTSGPHPATCHPAVAAAAPACACSRIAKTRPLAHNRVLPV
eukprot:365860-Chlamydomonas_euryale.AAC.8